MKEARKNSLIEKKFILKKNIFYRGIILILEEHNVNLNDFFNKTHSFYKMKEKI